MTSPAITIDSFFHANQAAALKPTTVVDYEIQIRHFRRYWHQHLASLGEVPTEPTLGDLSIAHIYGAMNAQLTAGCSKGTADKIRRAMSSMWYHAADLGLVDQPKGRIKRMRGHLHEPDAWSTAEFGAILDASKQLQGKVGDMQLADWFPAILLLVYNSGLRISSAMAAEWDWIDTGGLRIQVPPKFQKDDEGKIITLLPEAAEAIDRLRGSHKSQVFGAWKFDRYQGSSWRALTLRLKRCIVAAGLAENLDAVSKRSLWHKVRRTFATLAYAASNDIEHVRDMLGHSCISVTYRYIDRTRLGRRTQADLIPAPSMLPRRNKKAG